MSRLAVLVNMVCVWAMAGCDEGGGAGSSPSTEGSAVAAAPTKTPGAGFSADLAKRLDSATSIDTPPRTNNAAVTEIKPEATAAGSAAAGSAGSAATSNAGSTAGSASAGSASSDAKVGEPMDSRAAAGSADPKRAADPEAGSADSKVVGSATKEPPEVKGTTASTAPKIDGSVVIAPTATKPVAVSAELKAININLLPNWERDVEGAGTISFVVKIPGRSETAKFVFNYGIEDAKAPSDRDAYKKWLAENRIFVTKDDRQQGAAWYLIGTDGAGRPAFRMVVVYGGKKLICYGSQYKDSPLGDLRDQTIIQARQLCESLTL